MSLAALKARHAKRDITRMTLRGELPTPVATPVEPPRIPPKQEIQFTASGPRAIKFPGFLDVKFRPIWGSPEAHRALESALAQWRLTHGEIVDEG
jgi:hypothetical protein